MELENVSISALLPLFMREDKGNGAISASMDAVLRPLAGEIAKLSTFDALAELDANELDALATELNVLWYDVNLPIESKRALLANSDKVFMQLGTRAACVRVVRDVFGDADIQEFWEYTSGTPHHFRVVVQNASALSAENEAKLVRMLDIVKRKSQWLHAIYSETVRDVAARVAIGVVMYTEQLARIDTLQDNPSYNGAYIGGNADVRMDETNNITN